MKLESGEFETLIDEHGDFHISITQEGDISIDGGHTFEEECLTYIINKENAKHLIDELKHWIDSK